MNEKLLENEPDLSTPDPKPKMSKTKINRQSNITLEEDQESISSLKLSSKPLISILAGAKKNSSIFTILPTASSTLPKFSKTSEKCALNKINSQKSLNQAISNDPNSLSVVNCNFIDESISRKSSFNSVR